MRYLLLVLLMARIFTCTAVPLESQLNASSDPLPDSKNSRIQTLIESVLVAIDTESKTNAHSTVPVAPALCDEVTWYNVVYHGIFGDKRFCIDA